jgi:hypothetical protein
MVRCEGSLDFHPMRGVCWEGSEGVLSTRQELSRQGVGLASQDNSDTLGSAACEPESAGAPLQRGCANRYRLHALEQISTP